MCEVRDLKPNGANILVTEENKKEYVHLVCQMKMTGKIVVIPPKFYLKCLHYFQVTTLISAVHEVRTRW